MATNMGNHCVRQGCNRPIAYTEIYCVAHRDELSGITGALPEILSKKDKVESLMGKYKDNFEPTDKPKKIKLTADQQIRIAALNAAVASYGKGVVNVSTFEIVAEAVDFEHYIQTGDIE